MAAVATIESSECALTLAKVLDNILTERQYTKKLRTLKLSNPTLTQRVVRHVGGVDFLKDCGFTQRKDLLQLKQAVEDKGALWLARKQLHDHAVTKHWKFPPLPKNPVNTATEPPQREHEQEPTKTGPVASHSVRQDTSSPGEVLPGTLASGKVAPDPALAPVPVTVPAPVPVPVQVLPLKGAPALVNTTHVVNLALMTQHLQQQQQPTPDAHVSPKPPLTPNRSTLSTPPVPPALPRPDHARSSSNTSSLPCSMFTDDESDLESEIMLALMDEDERVPTGPSALPPVEIVTNSLQSHVSDDESSIMSRESHLSSVSNPTEKPAYDVSSRSAMRQWMGPPMGEVAVASQHQRGADHWGNALEPPRALADQWAGDALEPPTAILDMERLERDQRLEQEMEDALQDFNASMSSLAPVDMPEPSNMTHEVTPILSNMSIPAHPALPSIPQIHNIDELNAYFDEQSLSTRAPKRTQSAHSSGSDLESEMTRLLAEASELRGRTLTRSASWRDATEDPAERASSPSLRNAPVDTSLPEEFHYSSDHAHKDWLNLEEVMQQTSLYKEYEPCWGSLCTLSVVCSELPLDDLALPVLSSGKKKTRKAWLPLELVQGLWKLVLASEGKLNPLRIDDVCQTLHDVLVKSDFLEVYERATEDRDLPHPTWVRVRKEKMVLLGFALPISINQQNVWMKKLAKAIVEDVQFWFGRYALPTIALAGGDDQAMTESLLKDLEFIQTRLDVIGLVSGTSRHVQDCRAFVKAKREAFRDNKTIPDEQEPGQVAEIGFDVALDACQQVARSLYRTGQLLVKSKAALSQKHELCSALHILGMAAGEWGDYEFEIQIYSKAMKLLMDTDGAASVASADLLLSMGACNLGLGDFSSAMGCYEEAKKIYEGRLGKKHVKIAKALHLMGVVHCERSEQTVAMECFKMSLKIRQDNGMANDYDAAMADTLCWIGRVYREEGMPAKAKKYFDAAREAKEELFGTDSLEVAEILHNIAVIYDDEEDFVKSLSNYRKSLKIRRSVLGEEHEDVCELITCIGNVYRSMGDNSTALKAFRRALVLRTSIAKSIKANRRQSEALICCHEDVLELLSKEVSHAPDQDAIREEISSVLLKMGHLYDTISMFERSVKCFQKALKMRQNAGEGVKAAQVLNMIGISFAKRRKFPEAMASFEQSLNLRKEALGDWHSDVAETLHNMGNCAAKKGDLENAKSYYDEALQIKRKNFGNNNASVAQTLHNLGNVMAEKGSAEAAMQYYQDALSIRTYTLGIDHLDVAYSLHCIAKIHKKKHNVKSAQEYFNNALRLKRLRLRKNHPSIADTLEQLGMLHSEIGSHEEAAACLLGALNIFKSKNKEEAKVADIYEALGNMYEQSGDECNALNNFSKALRVQTKVYGEENIKVADMYYKVGLLQKAQKSTREALLSFQAATRVRKKASGRNDAVIADILCEAGQLQMQMKQVDVASKCFNEALRIRRQLLEERHEKIGESLLYVADVYFANGLNENAIESIIEGLDIFKLNGNGRGMLAAGACQRLGAAYNASSDFDKALSFYKQCLEIKTATSGVHSLPVAEINHELGSVYFARGDFARAEEVFRDSVEVKVKTLGEDCLEVASTVLFLGRVCLNMNSPDEAMMYFEQARLTKQLHLGDNHLECSEINRDIGDAHQAKGEFEESLACYNSYLRARRSAAGDDEIVADLLYSIGHIEHKLKRLDEALKAFASALALYRVLLGDEHSSVAKTLFGLGDVYEAKWEYKESMKYHKEAFRLRRRLLGCDDITVAESLDKIASLYMKQPNLEKALQSMKEALRIKTLLLGKDSLEVATSLFGMGVIFNDLKEIGKAMECYTVSLDIRKQILGECSLEVAQTLHNMGTVFAKERDYSNALSHWRQALIAYQDAGFSDENHMVAITIGNITMAENYQEEQAKFQTTRM